jgi:hypothetical protein
VLNTSGWQTLKLNIKFDERKKQTFQILGFIPQILQTLLPLAALNIAPLQQRPSNLV